MRQMQDWR